MSKNKGWVEQHRMLRIREGKDSLIPSQAKGTCDGTAAIIWLHPDMHPMAIYWHSIGWLSTSLCIHVWFTPLRFTLDSN